MSPIEDPFNLPELLYIVLHGQHSGMVISLIVASQRASVMRCSFSVAENLRGGWRCA
jgi:hypothetical protein